MVVTRQRMTLDEFLALPEQEPPLELFDGEVTEKLIGAMRRSVMLTGLCTQIDGYARPRKLGRVFPSLRCSYNETSTVLDVAYFTQERIPRDTHGRLAPDALIPPDVAVEIMAPERNVTDLRTRCLWYVANGVRLALLIDPDRRSVILFRPGSEPIAMRDMGTLDLGDVIPGFTLDVQELFAELSAE